MSVKKLRVYVAGPLSVGDVEENLNRAVTVGQELWELGFVPFIPHLDERWGRLYPKGRREWLDYDKHWFALCDMVLRLPGESPGSDQEERWAGELGLPVYMSMDQLLLANLKYTQALRALGEAHILRVDRSVPDEGLGLKE